MRQAGHSQNHPGLASSSSPDDSSAQHAQHAYPGLPSPGCGGTSGRPGPRMVLGESNAAGVPRLKSCFAPRLHSKPDSSTCTSGISNKLYCFDFGMMHSYQTGRSVWNGASSYDRARGSIARDVPYSLISTVAVQMPPEGKRDRGRALRIVPRASWQLSAHDHTKPKTKREAPALPAIQKCQAGISHSAQVLTCDRIARAVVT